MSAMMEGVTVAARCRPLTPSEAKQTVSSVEAVGQQIILNGQRSFQFNKVYGPQSDQHELYTDLVQPAINQLRDGFNVTVMAYGQTGAGKTYTMGTDQKVTTGIIPRALEDIFLWNCCKISLSFLEVYKEEIFDLLSKEPQKLQVLDFQAHGLTRVNVKTVEDARKTMQMGFSNRRIGATGANARSSRSHAVCTIYVTTTESEGVRESKLNLVDLAGSESVSGTNGDRRIEGIMINKGLLQLGNVMYALSAPSGDHVPYRNSALTSILKDTLTPNQFIILIACISPVEADSSETINTLKFATRVSNIKSLPEAGLIINQRTPMFKTPFTPKGKLNSTIATPGSIVKHLRHPLLPVMNHTIDSPRQLKTPRGRTPYGYKAGRREYPVTSTPAWGMPPVPNPNRDLEKEQNNEPEWALNISSSTTVDGGFMKSSLQADEDTHTNDLNHTSSLRGGFSEDQLRKLIRDTVTEVVRREISLTFSESHRPLVRDDGALPSKKIKKSIESEPSIFNSLESTVLTTSSPNKHPDFFTASAGVEEVEHLVRRSLRFSLASMSIDNKENVLSTPRTIPVEGKLSHQTSATPATVKKVQKRESPSYALQRTLRRSTRLSMRGNRFEKTQNGESSNHSCERIGHHSKAYELEKKQCGGKSHLNSNKSVIHSSKSKQMREETHNVVRRSSRLSNGKDINKSCHSQQDAQVEHNKMILHILQTGNAKQLMSLPTVGPKTSTIICNHRLLHGPLENFQDLKNIRGLSAGFPKRFLWANNIVIEE